MVLAGIILPIFLILLGFIIPYPWVRYPFFLISFLLTTSYLLVKIIPRCIEITRKENEVFTSRFKPFTVYLEIRNKLPLPLPVFILNDLAPTPNTTESKPHAIRLKPLETLTIKYNLEGMRRGCFQLGPITASGRDPLNIFSWDKKWDEFMEIIIFPSIHLTEIKSNYGIPGGNILSSSPIFEDPTRFKSLRPYVKGDEIRHINWKASARLGKLVTKEYESAITVPIKILLNLSFKGISLRYSHEIQEKCIELAGSILFYFNKHKQPIKLITNGLLSGRENSKKIKNYNISSLIDQSLDILKVLALLQSTEQDFQFVNLLDHEPLKQQERIFVISPVLSEEELSTINFTPYMRNQIQIILISSLDTPKSTLDVTRYMGLPVKIIKSQERGLIHEF